MLIDTTLREGAQLFGAYFSVSTRADIVAALVDIGLDEIELGWVGQEGLEELIHMTAPLCGKTACSVWSPCRPKDIRAIAKLGMKRINIGVPVSDLHMRKRLKTDREGLLEKLASTVLTASLLGIEYISVGLEDVSRADRSFALAAACLAQDMGASRVRLSDSLGILSPQEMQELIMEARKALNIDIAVHCHDDFGMGTANALTALNAGADYADGSILGIGERSGIAATEELAAFLTLKEKSHAYRTEALRPLCHFVSTAAGVPVPRTKSVAGKDIFACESGIHAHAIGKSPALFEPYAPEAIGADRTVAIGGKSGRGAIATALNENNIPHDRDAVPDIVAAVRKLSWELERPLTTAELTRITKAN